MRQQYPGQAPKSRTVWATCLTCGRPEKDDLQFAWPYCLCRGCYDAKKGSLP